jgi:hypothetical protein
MPDVRDVKLFQGSDERGKDIVFYSRGPLGEDLICAAVVKNKKITGKVDRSTGARTLFVPGGTDVVQRRVAALLVVEDLDVVEELLLRLGSPRARGG